jgi:hypothetical protein
LFNGLAWGGLVAGVFQLLGAFGILDQELADALSISSFAGIMGWQGAHAISAFANGGFTGGASTLPVGLAPVIGLGIGVAVFFATYEETKQELIKFQCFPWEPPLGGHDCHKCNEDPLMPCSEYRCKSLGQACELLNPGTDEELCDWVGENDVIAPTIRPWEEALKPGSLEYVSFGNVEDATPPTLGYEIRNTETDSGCLVPYSKIEFGIEADEPAQCKIDFELKDTYTEMGDYLGESRTYKLQHAHTNFRIPELDEEAVFPVVGDDVTMYIRCVDYNGNEYDGNGEDGVALAFRFCIDPGPDTEPPVIEGFSINSGSPVRFEIDNIPDFEVYVNEPAECAWSRDNKAYEAMVQERNEAGNPLECFTDPHSINADLNYICTGTLTGINDGVENTFYFRCQDFNDETGQNFNRDSTPLVLLGTEPLTIESTGPTDIINSATLTKLVNLTVETAHGAGQGADEGLSTCSYSTISTEDDPDYSSYVKMDHTYSYEHWHTLELGQGTYTYYFICNDDGNNLAFGETTFTINVDTLAPRVSRVYKEGDQLMFITDEDADCYYSESNCNYNTDEALGFELIKSSFDRLDLHQIDWNPEATYYVKCKDMNGKEPSPNACTIIVKGSDY